MSHDPPEPESAARNLGVPRSPKERDYLLEQRGPGWEHLFFAGILWQGKEDLELSWRDHELRLPTAPYRRLRDDEVPGFVSESMGHLTWLIEPLSRVFDAQEDAFGKPGEPGNEQFIGHFARGIISVYEALLKWAGTVRSADPPDEFRTAVQLCAHAADTPAAQIREFVDHVVEQVEQIPRHFARPEADREQDPLRLDLTLTLNADEALLDEAIAELQNALNQ